MCQQCQPVSPIQRPRVFTHLARVAWPPPPSQPELPARARALVAAELLPPQAKLPSPAFALQQTTRQPRYHKVLAKGSWLGSRGRRLTFSESARLMGYSSEQVGWSADVDTNWRLLGNTIAQPMMERLLVAVLQAMMDVLRQMHGPGRPFASGCFFQGWHAGQGTRVRSRKGEFEQKVLTEHHQSWPSSPLTP